MSDPAGSETTVDGAETARSELCAEITRTLSGVRQRHAGGRRSSISTQIRGDTVECHVTDSAPDETDGADGADGDEAAPPFDSLVSGAYKSDAQNAVAKVTHRRVMAFIPKRDKETGTLTEKFILDGVRKVF